MKKLILALALIVAADTVGVAQSSTNRQDTTKRQKKMERENRRNDRNNTNNTNTRDTPNSNTNYNKDYNQQPGSTNDTASRRR